MKFFDWQIPAEKGLLFTYLSRIFPLSVCVTEIHDKFVLIKSASNKHEFLAVHTRAIFSRELTKRE